MNENEQLVKDLRKLYKMANRRRLRIRRQIDKHNAMSPGPDGNRNEVIDWSKKRERLHNKLVRWHYVMHWLAQEIYNMDEGNKPKQYEQGNDLPF